MHRLEPVAHVGKRAPDDDRHRVVEIRPDASRLRWRRERAGDRLLLPCFCLSRRTRCCTRFAGSRPWETRARKQPDFRQVGGRPGMRSTPDFRAVAAQVVGMTTLRNIGFSLLAAAALALPASAKAKAKAEVTCSDGTTSKAGRGACSHHGGIADASAAASKSKARADTSSGKAEEKKPEEKKGSGGILGGLFGAAAISAQGTGSTASPRSSTPRCEEWEADGALQGRDDVLLGAPLRDLLGTWRRRGVARQVGLGMYRSAARARRCLARHVPFPPRAGRASG